MLTPIGTALIRHLAQDPAFVGIGPAAAARLWDRFGDDLPRVLGAGAADLLATVVGEDRAAGLVAAWREHLAVGDIVVWLGENGFDLRLAGRILALWGADAARRLRKRPYDLMALAPWKAVDQAALQSGVKEDDPARLVAAVESVLYDRFEEHHTWIAGDELIEEISQKLEPAGGLATEALCLAVEEGAAFAFADGYQAAGAHMMEGYVAARLSAMMAAPPAGDLVARPITDADVETWLRREQDAGGWSLDPEQRQAVRMGAKAALGLLVGGAGVGKTTVLKAVCGVVEAHGHAVHLVALAGRAAVRMSEATHRPASTIAAFLGRIEAGEVALGPQSLLVVDEASMVDLPTAYRILRRLPDGCRLLLVGDDAQLPPIGFGLVFHKLVALPEVSLVRLIRVHRQAAATGIPHVAMTVRAGTVPMMNGELQGPQPGVVFLDGSSGGQATLDDIVDAVAACGGWRDDMRVLCPTKGGDVGTEAVNAYFHDILTHGRECMAGTGYAVGEPVMFLRNDYRLDLRNGSLGVVTGIATEALEVDFDGVRHELAGRNLDDTALAYAITVHKAQGTAFRRIVVPVAPTRLLDRSLVYTAITRAQEQAVLVGDRKAFEKAVTGPMSAHVRQTGLLSALMAQAAAG